MSASELHAKLLDVVEHINHCTGGSVGEYAIVNDELTIETDKDNIHDFLVFLRDDSRCQFKQLTDVCGVDYPEKPERFEVVYHLLSMANNFRMRVKITTSEDIPVNSVSDIFSSAGWAEREVWDMYGVMFAGHPDHRRILTDYGFDGHPQRKDFPLTGYVELRYDEDQKRVVYEPVELRQDFRMFDNLSPWDGMTDVQLPGDEKAEEQDDEHGYNKPYKNSASVKGAK